MGFWELFRGRFEGEIALRDDGRTLVARHDLDQRPLGHAARLVVRPGQSAVFLRDGEVADVFTAGRYDLCPEALPILMTLVTEEEAEAGALRCEVWFVSTRPWTDRRWSTPEPILFRDEELGAVRLHVRGSYTLTVLLPGRLLRTLAGSRERLRIETVERRLADLVTGNLGAVLAERDVPVLDLVARTDELGNYVEHRVREDFLHYGLTLSDVLVQRITLPREIERALEHRASRGIIADEDSWRAFEAARAHSPRARGIRFGVTVAHAARRAPPPPAIPIAQPVDRPPEFTWHVAIAGKPTGPHPHGALPALVARGDLQRSTLVWRPGQPDWKPAGEVEVLDHLWPAEPPPLPPHSDT